jgi:hypothetical protein
MITSWSNLEAKAAVMLITAIMTSPGMMRVLRLYLLMMNAAATVAKKFTTPTR